MRNFAIAVVLGVVVSTAPVLAEPTVQVKSGKTTITLDEVALAMLSHCDFVKIKPAVVKPGGSIVRLTVSGGAIDTGTAMGEVEHSGGFSLFCMGTEAEFSLQNLRIEATSEAPVITAIATIGGELTGRFPILSPAGESPVEISNGGRVQLRDVSLLLTDEAVELLNSNLSTTFVAGDVFGHATSSFKVWPQATVSQSAAKKAKQKDSDKPKKAEEQED